MFLKSDFLFGDYVLYVTETECWGGLKGEVLGKLVSGRRDTEAV